MAIKRPYLKRNDDGEKYEFLRLQGAVSDQAEQVEAIERTGIDGVAFRTLGKKAGGTQWVAIVDVRSKSAAQQLETALRKLQGQFCEMGDEIGNVQKNVMVMRSQSQGTPRKMGAVVGGLEDGNGEYLIRFNFVLKLTEV